MPRLSDEQLREFLTGGRNMMRLATLTAEGVALCGAGVVSL